MGVCCGQTMVWVLWEGVLRVSSLALSLTPPPGSMQVAPVILPAAEVSWLIRAAGGEETPCDPHSR